MRDNDALVIFSETAFRQLQRYRKQAKSEASVLYADIVRCLNNQQTCATLPSRSGRKKLIIGPYRVICEKVENVWVVLRIYRQRS